MASYDYINDSHTNKKGKVRNLILRLVIIIEEFYELVNGYILILFHIFIILQRNLQNVTLFSVYLVRQCIRQVKRRQNLKLCLRKIFILNKEKEIVQHT